MAAPVSFSRWFNGNNSVFSNASSHSRITNAFSDIGRPRSCALARFGTIRHRAQAEIASARRSDTPLAMWPRHVGLARKWSGRAAICDHRPVLFVASTWITRGSRAAHLTGRGGKQAEGNLPSQRYRAFRTLLRWSWFLVPPSKPSRPRAWRRKETFWPRSYRSLALWVHRGSRSLLPLRLPVLSAMRPAHGRHVLGYRLRPGILEWLPFS